MIVIVVVIVIVIVIWFVFVFMVGNRVLFVGTIMENIVKCDGVFV